MWAALAPSIVMAVNAGTVTTRLTTTIAATIRITRRRGSRTAGASCPSDSSPENASQAAANPAAASPQRITAMCPRWRSRPTHEVGGSLVNTAATSPSWNTSAVIASVSASRDSSRTPIQVQEPEPQDRDHRQQRNLVREGVDRGDVVQRRHHRDCDGEQVRAHHQRAGDDAHARAERLGGRRDAAAPLRVPVRDLEVTEGDEHEHHRDHQHEPGGERAHLRVQDRRHVEHRRPDVREHDRPGEQGPEVPDADAPTGRPGELDLGSGAL